MIRHVFTLIWHRKYSNSLLILELLVTFLILFGLASFTLHLARMYRIPLGFEFADAWSVDIATGRQWQAADEITLQQVMTAVTQMNQVESVHLLDDLPFISGSGSSTTIDWQGGVIPVEMNEASDGLTEALGLQLQEGRWYGPQDDGQTAIPLVINRVLRDMLGEGEVLGTELPYYRELKFRIVGVFTEFRQDGEFSPELPLLLIRKNDGPDVGSFSALGLTVMLKSGVTAEFEEDLQNVLQGVVPDWDFDIVSWTSLRDSYIRTFTIPLLVGGIVVFFLLLLVGFGMLGVLWQNIIRRMPEMGLRRALGATASMVRLQVVLELLAMACLALILGFAIAVQFPLSGILQALDWNLFIPAAITSTLGLLGLCVLFALYPSYQATSRDPVEALRYE
jgi:putative ABC transport system permease protein